MQTSSCEEVYIEWQYKYYLEVILNVLVLLFSDDGLFM